MATKIDLITIGDKDVAVINDDPTAAGGTPGLEGDLGIREAGQNIWIKSGAGDTDWRRHHNINADTTQTGADSLAIGSTTTTSSARAFAGGNGCTASANDSFAFGVGCVADGVASFALGRLADAGGFDGAFNFSDQNPVGHANEEEHSVMFVFENGLAFNPNGSQNAMLRFKQATDTSTNATPQTIITQATEANTTLVMTVHITGKRTGGASGSPGDTAIYKRTVTVKNVSGTVTIVGEQNDYTYQDVEAWDVTFSVNGTDVEVDVVGASTTQITWHANYWIERT